MASQEPHHSSWGWGLAVGVLLALWAGGSPSLAQNPGEILQAYVLDVPSDVFGCRGEGTCNLRYRMYHLLTGTPVINSSASLDGRARYAPKRRGYRTGATVSGNFPGALGVLDLPFFNVWDGVIQPGSAKHAGYYGVQSQLVHFGETGNSARPNCNQPDQPGPVMACFEPLTSITSSVTLSNGLRSIGGLAPIPVPQVVSQSAGTIRLRWQRAVAVTAIDGAPEGIAGYRLYVYPGENPNQAALNQARLVAELASPAEISVVINSDNPALDGVSQATFALRLVYVGNLESLFFSANSKPVQFEEEDQDDEEEVDADEDGVDDSQDNCPGLYNPDQLDADGDGTGDACETNPEGSQESQEGGAGRREDGAARAEGGGMAASPGGGPARNGSLPGGPVEGDADGDGRADAEDNCAGLSNPGQADRDHDGTGDACDPDADGDHVDDDVDCDVTDPGAGRPAREVGVGLQAAGRTGQRWQWPGETSGPYRFSRGSGRLQAPFEYNHSCFWGGLRENEARDAEEPSPGSYFYYLSTGESRCGPGSFGRASTGLPRPAGEPCLDVAIARVAAPESDGGNWSLRVLGGSQKRLRIDVVVALPPTLHDLYAVSLVMVYDPDRMIPDGHPAPGPLLGPKNEPLRVDSSAGASTVGELRFTVARTDLVGVDPAVEDRKGVLLSTQWRSLGPGETILRLDAVHALDSVFQPVALPGPGGDFLLRVH
ncbi:MAG: thrombospondin type 3 repeat-containing protein [Acidobacteriota bacterium]